MAFDLRQGIIETANALGMPPSDLATIIQYESGLNPGIWGGAGGRHYGSIQFGPTERNAYGVEIGNPASQFGPNGAIVRYFQDRGWKPGMSFADAYSTVNAGAPGRMDASDEANGGLPGNVGDKVVSPKMLSDRRRAEAFLSGAEGYAGTPDMSMRAQAPRDYDPRLDTPSSGGPAGSELPGPPQGEILRARHPQNPQVGTGGYIAPGAPRVGVDGKLIESSGDTSSPYKPDNSFWKDLLSGVGDKPVGGAINPPDAGLGGNPKAALAQSQQSGLNPDMLMLKRQKLAEAMARLQTGSLWG